MKHTLTKNRIILYLCIVLLLLLLYVVLISSKNRIEQFEKKDKIVVCFFGVVSRSIQYTHNNLKSNLINILKKHYDVDIYTFNNNIEDEQIDGVTVKNNVAILNSTFLEEETQSFIDAIINENIKTEKIDVKMRGDYSKKNVTNSIRQMYAEEKIGNFLLNHTNDYKCAVVCGPDYYLLNNINLKHVTDSINNTSSVYTTTVNDGQGFTNGFYIGSLLPLTKILKRYSILTQLLPTDKDYEFLLKRAFDIHHIHRLITDTTFVKIRANKIIARQGNMMKKKYNRAINTIEDELKK